MAKSSEPQPSCRLVPYPFAHRSASVCVSIYVARVCFLRTLPFPPSLSVSKSVSMSVAVVTFPFCPGLRLPYTTPPPLCRAATSATHKQKAGATHKISRRCSGSMSTKIGLSSRASPPFASLRQVLDTCSRQQGGGTHTESQHANTRRSSSRTGL